MATKKAADDRSLKRLGGGRWQTHDERFTIEPQSGTWAIVDADQVDDLGLPLVRGPYRSLTEAKVAVDAARGTDPPKSPLADRVVTGPARRPGTRATTAAAAGAAGGADAPARGRAVSPAGATRQRPPKPEPTEPSRRRSRSRSRAGLASCLQETAVGPGG